MKLNHLDIQVPDPRETAAFFALHFQFVQLGNQHSPAIAILEGPGPFTLVIQKCKDPSEKYPEGFHVGFIVDDVAAVHAKHAAIKTALPELGDVQVSGRGTMFYFLAPGGVLVEVSCRARG